MQTTAMPPKRKSDALDATVTEDDQAKKVKATRSKKARVDDEDYASTSASTSKKADDKAKAEEKTTEKAAGKPKTWQEVVLPGEGEVRDSVRFMIMLFTRGDYNACRTVRWQSSGCHILDCAWLFG